MEATREIRRLELERPGTSPCHIIALTANIQPEDRQKAQASGMNDFLFKPLKIKELESALARPPPTHYEFKRVKTKGGSSSPSPPERPGG